MDILKVSTKSNPNSVAGAIASIIKKDGTVEIQAIGAGAINQAIKSIAVARGFVAILGQDLICIPSFVDVDINDEKRTAIKLVVNLINKE